MVCIKNCFEIKISSFFTEFLESLKITDILEILDILEMGFTKEWFVLKFASKYVPQIV